MSDAESRIAHIKALAAARAKRYYEEHKEAIAQRRKEARKACRQALGKPEPAPKKAPAAPPAPVAEPVPEPVPAPRLRIKRPKTVAQAKREAEAKAKMMTYEQAVDVIASTDKINSDSSRVLYRNHLKTVKEILSCDDLITCFQDAPKAIQLLNDAKQKRDPTKDYSINSKKSFVQMILKLSDVLGISLSKETKQEYVDAFDVLKLDSKEQTKSRQEEAKESKEESLTFETYLPKVAEKFGKDSKEYLIASLHSIHGFRDNLQLRIASPSDEKEGNQLVIPPKGNPYIRLSEYKTAGKYGTKNILLPDNIVKLLGP